MRILHVVADGRPGGGTTNVLALTEDLVDAGHQVALATQTDSYALERGAALGASVHPIDFFRGRADPRAAAALSAADRHVDPQIVHVHGARAGVALVLSRVPRMRPTAYTVRGYHFLDKRPPVRTLAAVAERLVSRRADATVHVCAYDRSLADAWRLVPQRRVQRVIYNGIRVADIPAPRGTDPKLVAFLGRLTYQKDPLLIVEIARLLAPEGFRFKLIGGGELAGEVAARITELGLEHAVTVTGALPRDQGLEELRDAGIFLLPSRWEGLPIAPVEAMQMGIPVVVADVSGLPEVVDGGRAGLLVAERAPEAFAAAIRSLASSDDLRATLVRRARARVLDLFTRERVRDEYLELYEHLLRAKRRP